MLLADALESNIARVMVSTLGDDCLDEYFSEVDRDKLGPVGSWTTFKKNITICSTTKCKLEYLPVVPLPPGDNIIKCVYGHDAANCRWDDSLQEMRMPWFQ